MVKFTVLTHSSVEATVDQWFKTAGISSVEVLAVPDHLHFSVWAEDGCVVAKDTTSGETYFVEPFEFPRYADGLIADFVSNSTAFNHTQASLYFQGGNVLIGDDLFFIGADYPANSLKYINKVIVPASGEKPVDTIHRLYGEYMDRAENSTTSAALFRSPPKRHAASSLVVSSGPKFFIWETNQELSSRCFT